MGIARKETGRVFMRDMIKVAPLHITSAGNGTQLITQDQ